MYYREPIEDVLKRAKHEKEALDRCKKMRMLSVLLGFVVVGVITSLPFWLAG